MDCGENTRDRFETSWKETSRTKKNEQKVLSCYNMARKEHVGIQQKMASRHLNGEIKSFLLLDAQLSFNSNLELILLGLLQKPRCFNPQSLFLFLGISSPKLSLAGCRNCCQFLCQDAWPPHMAFTCGNDPHKNMGCYKGGEEVFIT